LKGSEMRAESFRQPVELDPFFKQLLVYLFAGSRGAEARVKIVFALKEKPSNINELARLLGVYYKAIQYQIGVLYKNKLVETPQRGSYGAVYFLTPIMERHLEYVDGIWKRFGRPKVRILEASFAAGDRS
jgi:DNA-binding transcriptional ArsR family regulator